VSIAEIVKSYIPQWADEGLLDSTLSALVSSAIALFSRYSPCIIASTVTVLPNNTAYSFSLPSTWETGLSRVVSIEYPFGGNPPTLLEAVNFDLYRDPSTNTDKLLFLNYLPVTTFAIVHTGSWTEETLSDFDRDSVALLAAAYVCDRFSAKYAGSTDDLIRADVMNWRTKTHDYSDAKNNYLSLFAMRTGSDPKTLAPAAAIAFGSMGIATNIFSSLGLFS
jgi:hypothetical protein